MNPTAKLSALAVMTAIGFASCSTDELQEVNTGEGISFTSQVSRATPTTLSNLDGFYVYADAAGYKHMFIAGMKAIKDGATSTYLLAEKVTWPADVNQINFWAYGPLAAKDYLTPDINATTQHIHDVNVPASYDAGGETHNDFVLTYAEARKTPGNQVSLEFHHALSQIELRARLGENPEEGRRVRIKGAWFVNINSKGEVQFADGLAEEYHHMSWNNLSQPTYYGYYFDDGSEPLLSNRPASIIANIANNDGGLQRNSSLMLIPQKLDAYSFGTSVTETPSVHEGEATVSETGAGAYILMLCRIETHHNTPVTEEGQAKNPAILVEENGHTHQLFPITKDNEGNMIYTPGAYGYTCVPVDIDWMPGKKYVYTLQFCGRGSGAGQYPPAVLPDVFPKDDTHINNPAADGKKPGDNVLDNEISFKVDVLDWTPAETDIKAN